MNIGKRIKIMRIRQKMTQKELGIKLGFDEKNAETRISQYEVGRRKPKKVLLIQICQIFDIPICILLSEHEDSIMNIYIDLYWLKLEGKEVIYISKIFDIVKIFDEERYHEFIKLIKP